MGVKEKKDIKSIVESVKFLAANDPQGFMILKSKVDVLKARSDLDRFVDGKDSDSELHIKETHREEAVPV